LFRRKRPKLQVRRRRLAGKPIPQAKTQSRKEGGSLVSAVFKKQGLSRRHGENPLWQRQSYAPQTAVMSPPQEFSPRGKSVQVVGFDLFHPG
jgi:hypothetical protein